MEDIVHYRHADEKYYVNKVTVIKKVDMVPTVEPQPLFVSSIKNPETERVEWRFEPVDQDAFKKAMSDNIGVCNYRTTYVVSEDLTKNTISFKVYIMSKKTVTVKKLTRKKFKITQHEQFSLTINKTTGDFSVYKKIYNKRKYYHTVRKNIITEQIKALISKYLTGTPVSDAATKIFYELLGYKPLLGYRDFFYEYLPPLSEDYFNPTANDSLPFFPFLNYVFKSGIRDLSYEFFPIFEYIYKKDKKYFHRRSLYDYIKHYYNIEDNTLFTCVLDELRLQTISAFETNYLAHKEKGGYGQQGFMFNLPGIHVRVLEFIKRYNIPRSRYSRLGLTTTNFYFDLTSDNGYEKIPTFFHKMIDYYGFDICDVVLNNKEDHNRCLQSIKTLAYFELFGIKLKINHPISLWTDNYGSYNQIYDALCIARRDTGTFKINNSFIKGLRELIPDGYTLLINQNNKPKNSHTVFWDHDLATYEKIYHVTAPNAPFHILNPSNKPIYYFWTTGLDFGEMVYPIESSDGLLQIIRAYVTCEMAKNKVFVTQIYSKAYFEKILFDDYGLKAKDFLVYTN
jgi:hypothetical protein